MRYEIKGGAFPIVVCNLESGEKMITERGSMVMISASREVSTIFTVVFAMTSKKPERVSLTAPSRPASSNALSTTQR